MTRRPCSPLSALEHKVKGRCKAHRTAHQVPLAQAVKEDVATAMFVMFNAMPASGLLSFVATLLVFIFFVTRVTRATRQRWCWAP